MPHPDPSRARRRRSGRARQENGGLADCDWFASPAASPELVAAHSNCPSKEVGGSLGQVTRHDVAPEPATFLAALDERQLCPVPLRTPDGVHVVRLDRRAPGAEMPFEAVRDRIAGYLAEAVWRRALSEYIGLLAGRARIVGIDIRSWNTPLVQ